MTDRPSTFTTGALAELLGADLVGPADLTLRGVNSLDAAGDSDLTFITSKAYAAGWSSSRAAAALISADIPRPEHDAGRRALLVVRDAERAMIALLEAFAPEPCRPDVGVHATAEVHPSASLGADCRVGPHVSIERGARIGARVTLHAGVRIYPDVTIGDDSALHANVVVRERCRLGRSVVLHAGAVIGTDGFNYRPDEQGRLVQVPHLGDVELCDGVEVGACSTIDRGKFGSTVVGRQTKIDNLVMLAHNVRVGRSCVIAGCTGIAGSTVVGDGVQIAGGVGIADHLTIGDGARLGARSMVIRDVPAGQAVFGNPADEARAALRQISALRKLPDLLRRRM